MPLALGEARGITLPKRVIQVNGDHQMPLTLPDSISIPLPTDEIYEGGINCLRAGYAPQVGFYVHQQLMDIIDEGAAILGLSRASFARQLTVSGARSLVEATRKSRHRNGEDLASQPQEG